ncbi:signal transduction histidine kinase [Methylobacterium sp. BE186]|uniref:ATP-binding protein n=1 Tax=Methylobacterium sp. BE186 TaxID=2817715 RepID=UPI00285E131D|nr:ATP-binding protein [Methylobacterium sp. BE186]MDR7039008.1 signal transduction histidine kinase [Methylobacterium sp. BE186]
MFEFVRSLWDVDSLSPHGICLLWRPELIWTHVVSDTLIALAYFSIPGALATFVSRRPDIVFGWMFWSFAVFITACGATHLFAIWTLWVPDYGAEALVKAVTALASVATAIALWKLLPQALALPSPTQLRRANEELKARIAERDRALAALELATAEQRRTEALLRQSQKMEAIGQLTGGVAHDFNNLLNVVLANLERVERRLDPASPLLGPVRDAMTGAERAAAVTHKLLAFARKQPLSPVSSDVNGLIGAFAELLRGTIGPQIRLETDLAPDLPRVELDPNQFENAILNLAVNARDAMPKGGVLTLATRALRPEEGLGLAGGPAEAGLVVEVRDTGAGMPPEVAARAFEPFFTTKPLGQGTGLGLSQVFGFAQQSGGTAAIVIGPQGGTIVRLLFPAPAPRTAPAPAASTAEPPALPGLSLAGA